MSFLASTNASGEALANQFFLRDFDMLLRGRYLVNVCGNLPPLGSREREEYRRHGISLDEALQGRREARGGNGDEGGEGESMVVTA